MTNRERALNILHYQPVDHLPAVHFGYWRELLVEWANQGKISMELAKSWSDSSDADRELDRILGWDFNWGCCIGGRMGLFPSFEQKILEVLPDGTQRICNPQGVIERVRPGVTSIPSEDDYLLHTREDFEQLYLPKMQFSPNRIDKEKIFERVKIAQQADRPIGLHLGSVLGEIRSMVSVVGMSYLMYDEDEELFADIVDAYAEMQYKTVEEVLSLGVKFDFGHYWEDICFNSGPLLSPAIFEELCAKHYKRRNDLCKK